MKAEFINKIESIIGHTFQNKGFLEQAYTRRSYSEENGNCPDNEVLETVGDAVINLYVLRALLSEDANKGISEGELTHMRQKLVCGANLARNCERLNLARPEYFLLGQGDIKNHIYKSLKIKEDLFESIIGAVAIDCDYNEEELYIVTKRMLDLEHLNNENNSIQIYYDIIERQIENTDNKNAVNYLQELFKSKQIPQVNYIDLGLNDGKWQIRAEILGWDMWAACGAKTKKEAKLLAAQELYKYVVKKINNNNSPI